MKGPCIGRHAHDAPDPHADDAALVVDDPCWIAFRAVLPAHGAIAMEPRQVRFYHQTVGKAGNVKVCRGLDGQAVKVGVLTGHCYLLLMLVLLAEYAGYEVRNTPAMRFGIRRL